MKRMSLRVSMRINPNEKETREREREGGGWGGDHACHCSGRREPVGAAVVTQDTAEEMPHAATLAN